MLEKSPEVHPTRHLVVLTAALFHVSFEAQNSGLVMLDRKSVV